MFPKRLSLLPSCLALFYPKCAFGMEYRIADADAFSDFVTNVNRGASYSETTVYLDSDVSLLDKTLDPIGNSNRRYFLGTFNGQGHVISDLKMGTSSSLNYTGLFGYSEGLTIRNVVLDSSCSITNFYNNLNGVSIGGIVGECNIKNGGQCVIENSVNMADVTFDGNVTATSGNYYLYLGGIIGRIYSSGYVKNCANYGSVTCSGNISYSYIGGIAGYLYGSSYNNLNYGTIIHSGETIYYSYLGGITGYSSYAHIENSVSAGKISPPKKSCVGSIVGKVDSYTYVNYCYYTSSLAEFKISGTGTMEELSCTLSYDNITFMLSGNVSVGNFTGDTLIDLLNATADYYFLREYSQWLFNKGGNDVNFTINNRTTPISLKSQIILLPTLASEVNNSFDGWYNDTEYVHPLKSFDVAEDMVLYGRFGENILYSITFDTRKKGVFVATQIEHFGANVSLPSESIRDYCAVSFWETVYGVNVGLLSVMLARNITLYAVWSCTRITTLEDFVEFSSSVNKGANFLGTTVLLGSDLSLTETVGPTGFNSTYQFLGVFDGQGYIISNLTINSSSQYTGLFGYSDGLTIKNVVLDSSCVVESSYDGGSVVYAGGIIGYCNSGSGGECKIIDIVNMADVAVSENASSDDLYLGGIAGYLYSHSHDVYVRNCVNYGSVTHSRTATNSYVGGIVGSLQDSNTRTKYLRNCLNYGTITHTGTTSNTLFLGGITGYSYYTYLENCVSAGEISTQNTPSTSYIGSIVGEVSSYTYFSYCYYTADVKINSLYGTGMPQSASNTPTSSTTVDQSLITRLNDYASSNEWNKWLLNTNNAAITFTANNEMYITLSSQVVLLPGLADSSGRLFSGWYSDEALASHVSSEVQSDTTIYGMFCESNYTVVLNVNGGSASSIPSSHHMAVECDGYYGALPAPTKEGHTFVGWFTEMEGGEKVGSGGEVKNLNDHALYAHWTINDYVLTFDFDNGAASEVRVLEFDESITYPSDPVRKRHTFLGWNDTVKFMPAKNFTITALWSSTSTSQSPSLALVIGIVIPALVIVIIVIFVLFAFMRKKRENDFSGEKFEMDKPLITGNGPSDGYCRVVAMSKAEVEGNVPSKASRSVLSHLYPKDYARPSVKEALAKAKLTDEQIEMVWSACDNAAKIIADEGKFFDGFTKEDAAAIAMYTYDFGSKEFECNPYRIINRSIVERNYASMQKASGLLYLVMTALRKLPRVTGITLYRGVKGEVNLNKDYYYKGNIITWPALSSTSPDMEATKAFLARGSKSGNAVGTLFIIEGGWGYNIQPYSLFPDEVEILVEPERQFEVVSVVPSSDLTVINLKMLDIPLILPHVFGDVW